MEPQKHFSALALPQPQKFFLGSFFLLRQNLGEKLKSDMDKSDFVLDKKYFVQADGQGISFLFSTEVTWEKLKSDVEEF